MKRLSAFGLVASMFTLALILTGTGVASASQPKVEPEGGTFPVSFESSGGASKLETTPEGTIVRTVNCTENTGEKGRFSTATVVDSWIIAFKGCTGTGPFGVKLPCSSAGAKAEEIITQTLRGTLFFLKTGSSEVGIDLKPEKLGEPLAEFTCGGIQKMSISGGVIGKLTPVNTLTKAFSLTFSQAAGRQSPEEFLGSSGCSPQRDVLSTTGTKVFFGGENFGPIQSGLEAGESLSLSKKIKVTSTSCS